MIHNKHFKRAIIGLVVAGIMTAIAFPWWSMHQNNIKKDEQTKLQIAAIKFEQQYGTDNITIVRTEKLKDILATYWTDEENMHISIELGSAWVEVFRQPLNTDNTTEGQ